jgi:hypothetical protein
MRRDSHTALLFTRIGLAGLSVIGWGCPGALPNTTYGLAAGSGAAGSAAVAMGGASGSAAVAMGGASSAVVAMGGAGGAAGAAAPPGIVLVRGSVVDARDGKTPITGEASATPYEGSAALHGKLLAGAFEITGPAAQAADLDMVITIKAEGFLPRKLAHPKAAGTSSPLPVVQLCPEADASKNDPDGDGICSQAEQQYGTDPAKADSDGDALSDGAELFGEFEGGTMYSIRALGANPNHKDVFLEIDFMPGKGPSQHDVGLVVAAFKKAPVTNRDNVPGIELHAYIDQEVPSTAVLLTYGEVEKIRSAKVDPRRRWSFHYGLFANRFETANNASSGLSLGTGATFIVTLAGPYPAYIKKEDIVPGTLMHELGHNLGLDHSGFTRGSDGKPVGNNEDNYRPHYFSVMNYNYQMTPFTVGGVTSLDYARHEVAGISENRVDEEVAFVPKPPKRASDSELMSFSNLRLCTNQAQDALSNPLLGNAYQDLDLNRNGKIDRGTRSTTGYKPNVFKRDLDGNRTYQDFEPLLDDWTNLVFDAFHNPVVPPGTNLRLVDDTVVCKGPPVIDPAAGEAQEPLPGDAEPPPGSDVPEGTEGVPGTSGLPDMPGVPEDGEAPSVPDPQNEGGEPIEGEAPSVPDPQDEGGEPVEGEAPSVPDPQDEGGEPAEGGEQSTPEQQPEDEYEDMTGSPDGTEDAEEPGVPGSSDVPAPDEEEEEEEEP